MTMDLQSNPLNELLYVSFNQDYTCFVCGTESGFRVYSTDPFRLTWSRDFSPGGGLGVVAMLFRTNILAFAGGGRSPKYQPHKVVLWDDRQARTIAELSFRSAVRSVRLRRDLVVVVVDRKVYVYGFRSLSLLDSIETIENRKGLCCLSIGSDRTVLVCPGMQQGRALVIFYPRAFGEQQAPVARERTTIVAAHESSIAAMGVDYNGTLLATASDKGTIVRVYDTSSGSRRQELRRGADRAEIHSLTFSPSGEFLCVSSDKGTIHIFAVGRPSPTASFSGYPSELSTSSDGGGGPGSGNAKSSLQRISRVLPAYFSSEWSLAQFRVPDYRCLAAFGAEPHTVVAVCANGSYYKARFDPVRGGEMERLEYHQFDDAAAARAPTTLEAAAAAATERSGQQPPSGEAGEDDQFSAPRSASAPLPLPPRGVDDAPARAASGIAAPTSERRAAAEGPASDRPAAAVQASVAPSLPSSAEEAAAATSEDKASRLVDGAKIAELIATSIGAATFGTSVPDAAFGASMDANFGTSLHSLPDASFASKQAEAAEASFDTSLPDATFGTSTGPELSTFDSSAGHAAGAGTQGAGGAGGDDSGSEAPDERQDATFGTSPAPETSTFDSSAGHAATRPAPGSGGAGGDDFGSEAPDERQAADASFDTSMPNATFGTSTASETSTFESGAGHPAGTGAQGAGATVGDDSGSEACLR